MTSKPIEGAYRRVMHNYIVADGVLPRETRLDAGVYQVRFNSQIGVHLIPTEVKSDDLLELPGFGTEEVVREIQRFWDRREHYARLGAVHKRGVILAGEPGTGKTSTVQRVVEWFVERHDGVVLSANDVDYVGPALRMVRAAEPARPIVVTIEDFEDALRRGSESGFLQLLDGRDQVDGVVFLVTTNHLDVPPPRLANRPSRFDLVVTIGMPTEYARRAYLHARSHLNNDDIERAVVRTKNWSIAHLKELVILMEVYESSLENAVARLEKIIARKLVPDNLRVSTEPRAVHESGPRDQAVVGVVSMNDLMNLVTDMPDIPDESAAETPNE